MGLDIVAGGYGFRAGSYSGFGAFRDWCARQLGYTDLLDYYQQMEAKYGIEWNDRNGYNAKANFMPLGYLLYHSDCDGKIPHYGAQKTLKDLEKFKSIISEHNEDYEELVDHWIKACKEAIKEEDFIYFG